MRCAAGRPVGTERAGRDRQRTRSAPRRAQPLDEAALRVGGPADDEELGVEQAGEVVECRCEQARERVEGVLRRRRGRDEPVFAEAAFGGLDGPALERSGLSGRLAPFGVLGAREDRADLTRRRVSAAVEPAVDHDPRSDARADRDVDDVTVGGAGTVVELGEREGVDVVLEPDGDVELGLEAGSQVEAVPAECRGQVDPTVLRVDHPGHRERQSPNGRLVGSLDERSEPADELVRAAGPQRRAGVPGAHAPSEVYAARVGVAS